MTPKQHVILMFFVTFIWIGIIGLINWSPGLFNVDEIHYVTAAQRFADHQTFTVPNGYEQFKTNTLLYMHPLKLKALPSQDVMTTFIPPLWTFPSAIAWALGGVAGIKVMNALCYAGSLLLLAFIAGRITADQKYSFWNPFGGWITFALAACGTFFTDYAFSANSHMLSLVLLLGAVGIHPTLWERDEKKQLSQYRFILFAAICGLLIGYAIGVRLQNIFFAAILGFSLFFLKNKMVPAMVGYLVGLIIPISLMGCINFLRFGSANPFSYGIKVQSRLQMFLNPIENHPFAAIITVVVLIALGLFVLKLLKSKWEGIKDESKSKILFRTIMASFILFGILYFILLRRNFAERILGVGFFLGPYDYFRGLDPLLVFWNGFKISLLPSVPILSLGFLAPLLYPKNKLDNPVRIMLIGLAWIGLFFICYIRNTGGFFPNQRYCIEFAAIFLIIATDIINCYRDHLTKPALIAGSAATLILILIVAAIGSPGLISTIPLEDESLWSSIDFYMQRFIPLIISLFLCLSVFAIRKDISPHAPAAFSFFLVPCLLLPVVSATWYQSFYVHGYRSDNMESIAAMDPYVTDGTVIFLSGRERELAGFLKLERDIWIADIQREGSAKIFNLIEEINQSGEREQILMTLTAARYLEATPEEWAVVNEGAITLLKRK